ncbi:MAG: hypothetical protein DSY90_11195 [Deltaproteobacteria bacterium]|nr:MAG: hypothetical protein DSY90_11195 [Deltaproteobacteria bacterium]
MSYWGYREQLSQVNRLRRSYYELLRDEFDQHLVQYALIDSYDNFLKKKLKYPFVEKRELKPRARIPDVEYESHNAFLVIFQEDSVPASYKKYIHFLNVNKTTKANILQSKTLPLTVTFDRYQKNLDSAHFFNFLNLLLPVDYALLIQRVPASQTQIRYSLTHFHVRIDWPIAEAAESMACRLRYISKELYERGDEYAENIQKKFFEYYGLPVMAGGRRTAAVIAAEYLRKTPCLSTVYVGSSESRALMRISERGVVKTVLMKLSKTRLDQIAAEHSLKLSTFSKKYVVAREGRSGICIFQVVYSNTEHGMPPVDGKLREIKPDLNWIRVSGQYLIPRPGVLKYPPLPLNIIYS